MRTLNDIHGANDAEINSYLGDVSAVDFRQHVAEFSGEQRTLRDWFAGMFIQGGDPIDFDIRDRHEVAKYAYLMADAMLAAKKEQR